MVDKNKMMCNYIYLMVTDTNFKLKPFTVTNFQNVKENEIRDFYASYISSQPKSINGSRLYIYQEK